MGERSLGHCGLLSSHDDYSATQFLPPEAALITQIRDPVGRIVSAYEFVIEVAARVLNRPKNFTMSPSKTDTRSVWPWSILVPLVEEDMLLRVKTIPGSPAFLPLAQPKTMVVRAQ